MRNPFRRRIPDNPIDERKRQADVIAAIEEHGWRVARAAGVSVRDDAGDWIVYPRSPEGSWYRWRVATLFPEIVEIRDLPGVTAAGIDDDATAMRDSVHSIRALPEPQRGWHELPPDAG